MIEMMEPPVTGLGIVAYSGVFLGVLIKIEAAFSWDTGGTLRMEKGPLVSAIPNRSKALSSCCYC
jgi:hypothetical protein